MRNVDSNKLKGLAIYCNRLQGLLDDGYDVMFDFDDQQLIMAKLRHHNGNSVTLKLTYQDGILSQLTNNCQTFCKKVY